MIGLVQVGFILFTCVEVIYLLPWGYELVTMSIETCVLGVLIFVLEVYEFILYRRLEPKYLDVREYFDKPGVQLKSKKKSRTHRVAVSAGLDADDDLNFMAKKNTHQEDYTQHTINLDVNNS